MESPPSATTLTEEWRAHHFDHLSPALAHALHETLGQMRHGDPVVRSDEHGGFWVVTRHEDVLRVAQDWQTFSSAHGVSVPAKPSSLVAIPEHVDPPLHRSYKRLINPFFTVAAVAPYEQPTRDLVTRLIDGFIERGSCDFMADFATPFPGLAFFDLVLNAPADQLLELNEKAAAVSIPTNPGAREAAAWMFRWISEFVATRRSEPPRGDVVDAILAADIDGRPITDEEIVGMIQLLILGGLETTAGALGQIMIRFTREPEIPELLRCRPDLLPGAIEELLRLEPPFIAIGRTAMCDTEVGGQRIEQGEKVVIYWASANRDAHEFDAAATFDPARASNRHLAFGAGPHRCAGSNLARLNLRVALEELLPRLENIALQPGVEPLHFHSALNRAPLSVPITFTPGPRRVRTGEPASTNGV
jgi:cytochrome P450